MKPLEAAVASNACAWSSVISDKSLLWNIETKLCVCAQGKWNCDVGLGATLNTGNVNNCSVKNDIQVKRNDSIIALEMRYKLLYSSLINGQEETHHWQETEFEVYGGAKMSWHQYNTFSPFLAFEMLNNKYKGYDFKMSSAVGVKYLIYRKPSVCDY